MPYLTPASSPVHEPPSELDGVSAAAVDAVAEQAMTTTAQGSSSNCGAGGGYDTTTTAGVRTAVATAAAAPPRTTIQATAAAAATAESATAGGSRRGVGVVVAGNGSGGDEETEELEYEDVKVLTADLMVQRNSQGWALSAFPSSSSSSQQSQLSSSSDGGPDRSMSTNTNSQERLRENKISFKYNAPENLELAVIQCIFTKRMEDVNSSKEPRLEVTYKENLS
ncbi:hypothetical protein BGY98DRAFT_998034 [Russula aff. rugulosa BPL654]|nr:hypothetical protein BGY98DRAFT_998034 [Russula aff. rugulosa BPL654]